MNNERTRTRFETFMPPLINDTYNLARWLMKNQEDAEDMVQGSYPKAFRFFASFHDGTNCRACLLQIVWVRSCRALRVVDTSSISSCRSERSTAIYELPRMPGFHRSLYR